MAEETQKPESAAAPPAEEVTMVVEKPEVTENEPQLSPPAPVLEFEATEKPTAVFVVKQQKEEVVVEASEKAKVEESKITESVSFKEETNVVGELPEAQKKALDEFKQLIQEALNKHKFTTKQEEKPVAETKAEVAEEKENEEQKPAATVEVSEVPKAETEAPAVVEVKVEEKTLPPPPPAEEPAVVETRPVFDGRGHRL